MNLSESVLVIRCFGMRDNLSFCLRVSGSQGIHNSPHHVPCVTDAASLEKYLETGCAQDWGDSYRPRSQLSVSW